MNTAIILAQFWGITFVIMGIGMFFRRENISALVKLARDEGMMVYSGFLGVMLWVGHILLFNNWDTHWTLILTLIGWIMLCKGVVRVFIPEQTRKFVTAFHSKKSNTTSIIVFIFIVGLYLVKKGFGL